MAFANTYVAEANKETTLESKRVLIVEDDININDMLNDLLTLHGYDTTSAYSGTEALLQFAHFSFELILLDMMLPGKSGEEVLEIIRETSTIPVIAVTAVDAKSSIVSSLKNGANDYITKPFDNDVLMARIEVQLRNSVEANISVPKSITYKDITLKVDLFEAFIHDAPLDLSKKEYEILKLLIETPNKVFTKSNLYESVWKDNYYGDDNTINVHISNIRAKIAKQIPDIPYIKTVWGIGFKIHE